MKICVNTRFLIKDKLEGIGVFTFEILKEFCKRHPEHEFYFLFDRRPSQDFVFPGYIKPVILFPPARHPILWLIWYEVSVYRKLKRIKPDVFISMDGMIPLRSKVKSIAVIHDIAFESFPEAVPFLVRKYYQLFFPLYARKATKIITVSEFSQKDIAEKYHLSPDKIHVVYNGHQGVFKPLDKAEISKIREEISRGYPYFLYNGSLHPRKNVSNLLKAFDLFKEKDRQNIKLVISGRRAWKTKEMERVYENMNFKDEVIFTGWLPEKKLAELTASALAFVYVSLFEGFGIPVLNAMYCDVPVIVSNTSSLPEVAGDAALYTAPADFRQLADLMHLISVDEFLRKDLIEKGRKQREKFSWVKSAEGFYEVIRNLNPIHPNNPD